jgi:CRP-like cAMP-binding protein
MPTNCPPRPTFEPAAATIVDRLREASLFAGLDEAALEMIAIVAEPVHARAGSALACDTSFGDGIVVVLSGTVEVIRICERVAIVDAGGVVSDLAALGCGGRNATLLAGTDVEALHISGPAFSSAVDALPDLWLRVQSLEGAQTV